MAVRVRLYPTADQAALLAMTFGCKRFVWNAMLEERQVWYEHNGVSIGKHRKTEKELKVLYPFLKGVDSIALQQARIDLDAAYQNFFKKRARFPRFKSRKDRQSYRTENVNGNVKVDFRLRKLKLPKVGWVAYRDGGRAFTERVRSVTVSRNKSGKHFASMLIERELNVKPLSTVQEEKIAAFDMSARAFIVGEGEQFQNPRFYRSSEAKLKRLHRRLSRKVKGSNNREKARATLARLYDRIGNRRADWQHKLSTRLADDNDVIIIENLNIEGMKRWNGGLAKSVTLDFSWNEFTRMLGYKFGWRGKHLIKVDRFYQIGRAHV
jgi:putative transposase